MSLLFFFDRNIDQKADPGKQSINIKINIE